MSKATIVAQTVESDSLNSFEAIGYSQASANATIDDRARDALRLDPSFHETVTDEIRAQLYAGYVRKYAELPKGRSVMYALIDSKYIRVQPTDPAYSNPKVERVEITAQYVAGFTSHQIGQLGKTHGDDFKAIITAFRSDMQTYCSNRLNDLQKRAKSIVGGDKPQGTRKHKEFTETVMDAFKGWDKSVKVRHIRGDPTASPARFESAKKAFWEAYNKA